MYVGLHPGEAICEEINCERLGVDHPNIPT